ncbi:MAG: DUF2779 domain-containing protein [bacterium]|nr:DUF2779 domain-containing protein [bacterium]
MDTSWLKNVIEKIHLSFDRKNSPNIKISGDKNIKGNNLNVFPKIYNVNINLDMSGEERRIMQDEIFERLKDVLLEKKLRIRKNNMGIIVSKTDYILYRECPKNIWLKNYKPEVFNEAELSEFEKAIIETGNEVELVARQLFPAGFLIEGRDEEAQEKTQFLITQKEKVIFQPIFVKDGFLAAVDILELQEDGTYSIYEVKSTTDVDKKTHYHDLAFQVNLLEKFGIKAKKAYVIHLDSEYVREGEININKLFHTQDVTEQVEQIKEGVLAEMEVALKYLSQDDEPKGYCACVYKGRSNHCATFGYSNPDIPAYGVHDISRIGASKMTLQELVDVNIFELKDVPGHTKLTPTQKNQIEAHVFDRLMIDKYNINEELQSLVFPLYFLDYETFPSAIPRFNGFSPYQQIPFQYSLYVLDSPEAEPRHFEFIFSEKTDPSLEFLKSLQKNIKESGSIIVWNKRFECKINEELAARNPDYKLFIEEVNKRVYDLMDIFGKQYYVHKGFKGRISIKNILPVLVPELSYKTLNIQEGGTASQKWNEIHLEATSPAEKQKIIDDLKEYCKLDTYAMYAIWKHLHELIK